MKRQGLADLIGRSVVAVTVTEAERPPRVQLYLTLDDGSYFEIYTAEPWLGFASMARDGGLKAVRSEREDAEVAFEVVAGDDGRPRQTVATETSDLIENRKSLREEE